MQDLTNEHICEDCGKDKEDTRERECPFAKEIYDNEVLVKICNDCACERAMDI